MRIFACFLLLAFLISTVWALAIAPADIEMGDGYRVMFVHVPAAFMSLIIYLVMASCAFWLLISKSSQHLCFSGMLIRALAPIGALMTFLALTTGAIWGQKMWGTWWTWHDARLVSELILLFMYLGYIALITHVQPKRIGDKLGAILVLIGVINIPIIHFSVEWWTSLHQPPSLLRFGKPTMDTSMLYPLLAMITCYVGYCVFCAILAVKTQGMSFARK